ncbi:MAG: polysaccharide biosynthesis protein, partial [Solobacterium sp.]|nr:polysaccharide biosynthesis protein [Solobacterium sp.]
MSEGRTKKTARNVASAGFNMVLNIVLGFVNRTLFIRLLGAEYLGINGLFADILMMLSLADLGLTTAMAYSYYKPIAEKDTAKLSSLVRYYKRIYQFLAVPVAVCGLLLVPFLRFLVRTDRVIPNLELYYVLILANTVVSYLFVFKSTLISADQRQYV